MLYTSCQISYGRVRGGGRPSIVLCRACTNPNEYLRTFKEGSPAAPSGRGQHKPWQLYLLRCLESYGQLPSSSAKDLPGGRQVAVPADSTGVGRTGNRCNPVGKGNCQDSDHTIHSG